MKLTDYVSLNFKNNMSMAAVFLDIEKAFDITWDLGLLYKLSELQFLTSLVKLIASFLTNRKLKVSVEGELPSTTKVAAEVPQGSVLAPVLYSLYINDAPRLLEHTLLSLRTILLYTQQRNTSVAFSTNSSVASLLWGHGFSTGI
jgi:hypothetical protein